MKRETWLQGLWLNQDEEAQIAIFQDTTIDKCTPNILMLQGDSADYEHNILQIPKIGGKTPQTRSELAALAISASYHSIQRKISIQKTHPILNITLQKYEKYGFKFQQVLKIVASLSAQLYSLVLMDLSTTLASFSQIHAIKIAPTRSEPGHQHPYIIHQTIHNNVCYVLVDPNPRIYTKIITKIKIEKKFGINSPVVSEWRDVL